MNRSESPCSLGYRWPAEWEPQASTWVSWPRNPATWPGKFEPVAAEFARFVLAIAEFQPCNVLCGGTVREQAKALTDSTDSRVRQNVILHDYVTNDSWCRDHGPSFLQAADREPALVDWQYNAWGGKYPPFDLDNQVPQYIATFQKRRRFTPGVVLEGGAIDGNGLGTILTTKSCLLNPNRNPDLTATDYERLLGDYLAAKHVVWLTGGEVAGDDTDGHIDQLARFVGPRTVVCATCDVSDENHAPTQQNWDELKTARDQDGKPFDLVALPTPEALFHDGQRLPTSYCNFLIINRAVLVPQFGVKRADANALAILREQFPDREVRGLPSIDLIWGLGSFHCLSQQECLPRQECFPRPAPSR